MLQDFIYQALQVNLNGSIEMVCHEGTLQAFDLEAAVVTGHALLEVIPTSDDCNKLNILDPTRQILWSGPIEDAHHAHRI